MLRLIALHGLAGTSSEWDKVVAELAALDVRASFEPFDQPAHGAAANLTADLSRDAHVNLTVDRILRGPAPVVLIGQSAGAHTAMLVAARHPQLVSALVLVEGGVGGEGPEATDDVIAWVRSLVDDSGEPRFDPDAMRRVLEPIHAHPFWGDWDAVSCPTLIVRAEDSFIDDEEHARMARSPRAELVRIAGSGHDVHLDQPKALASAVAHLLAGLVSVSTRAGDDQARL